MKSLCSRFYPHSGRNRPKPYSVKSCNNCSAVLCFEWAMAGICTRCPARANPSTTHMVTEYVFWGLWYPRKWFRPTLWSYANQSPARLDESTKHHDDNDSLDSGVPWEPYKAADRQWGHFAVWWTINLGLLGWFVKVRLFRLSPDIILTDTNSQNGRLYGTLNVAWINPFSMSFWSKLKIRCWNC